MSIFRRPTRAAGHSWSKWEDPIVYKAPLSLKLGHLALWLVLGTSLACLAVLAGIPPKSVDGRLFLLADLATIGASWAALIGLRTTYVEIQGYDR